MTAQVLPLQLSHALAVELHALFRALDLRFPRQSLIRDQFDAACRKLDELRQAEWNLVPAAVAESVERIAELLRQWTPEPPDRRARKEIKAQLRELYAGFASALRHEQVVVPELRPVNIRRSVFHMSAAAVCLGMVAWLRPSELPWAAGAFALWAWSMETLRRVSPRANEHLMKFFAPIAHAQERDRINSGTWYMTALVLLTLTFSPRLCVVGVAVLGFADPIAGLVGRRWGRIGLVNNRSLEGTLTFVVVGTAAAAAAMLMVAPSLGPGMHWGVAFAAALAGGLAELFSRRIDDNLSIPMAAAGTAALVLALWGPAMWG